jgi:hypothetical protein
MLNIVDLEKRWLRYKIKQLAPYGAGSLLVVGGVLWFTLVTLQEPTPQKDQQSLKKQKTTIVASTHTKKSSEDGTKVIKPTTHTITKQESHNTQQKNIKTINTQANTTAQTTVLHPSMGFISQLEQHTQKNLSFSPPTQITPAKEKKHTRKKPQKSSETETTVQHTTQDVQTSTITIDRKNTLHDIDNVIQRFKKNHNPALSLFIAKKYYDLGDYQQAYNYALITNQIDKKIEGSWLIFAKALYKLGKEEKAMTTLGKYINYSHSSNAQILLEEMQRGKFR